MQQIDVASIQDYFRNLFSWKERRGGAIMPDERLPWGETTVLGFQHVLAMFGSTVLGPLLMGFDANVAIFFSGIGTILFFIITGGKIPSYLGSSFAFIGPVGAVTGVGLAHDPSLIPLALGGIIVTGLIYTLVGVAVAYWGSDWIDALMPPIVTGGVVAIIGLNLATIGAKPLAEPNMPLALITILSIVAVAILGKGLLGRLPILIGILVGYFAALILGGTNPEGREILGMHFQGIDFTSVREASIIGLPDFVAPKFDAGAIGLIAPVVVILIAENTGHIKAVSEMANRNMMPHLGRGFIGDGVATMVAGSGGGTGVTTYAENIGVMAVTKVYSTAIFLVAAGVAVLLGFSPMFGALVYSIPSGVLGGAAVVLFGLIAIAGIRIWVDNQVDFSRPINLFIGAIVLLVGTADLTLHIGNFALNGIALGTFGAIILYQVFSRIPGALSDDLIDDGGDSGPRDGGIRARRSQYRPTPEREPRRRERTGQRQERRPARREQPVMPPLDDLEMEGEADVFGGYSDQAPPEKYPPREQRPQGRPARRQPASRPDDRRQRPARPQRPMQDRGEGLDETGMPIPQMPQPPTIRRNAGRPQPEPEMEEWDDDFGFVRDDPRRPQGE